MGKARSIFKAAEGKGYAAAFWCALFLLLFLFLAALSVGRYSVPLSETLRILLSRIVPVEPTWSGMSEAVVLTLRLPRALAAVLIGAALALSGGVYQSIFKNPMVSPDLLGVSSGACVGAALAILLDAPRPGIQLAAFLAGTATVLVTTCIPRLIRNDNTTILVLSGVIMSSLMSSVMSIIKSVADTDTKLAEITYWTMGSFSSIEMKDIRSVLPAVLLPMLVILRMRYRLNVLSLGDNEARTLGIDLRRTRGVFILCSTLITAGCVCLAGTIGWVGLIIPHTARLLVGADNQRMLPLSLLIGSGFMLVIDTLCRTVAAAELRLGILTGVVGAPFFLFLLVRQHRRLP